MTRGTVCFACQHDEHDRCDTTAWTDLTERPTFCSCWADEHR